MQPPIASQRIEQLEEKATEMEDHMVEMVSKAVEAVMSAMRHSFTELFLEGQAANSRK